MRGGRPPPSSRAMADCVCVAERGELRLGETELVAPLGDLRRDRGKEPTFLGVRESSSKPLHLSRRGLP